MECRVKVQKVIRLQNGNFATEHHYYTRDFQLLYTLSCICLIELKDERLALGSFHEKEIKIWNPKTKKSVFKLNGHKDLVQCLIELHNGLLASGSDDKTIKLWDLNIRQCLTCILTCSLIRCLVELNDGRLAYPCGNRSIKLLQPSTHKFVNVLKWNSSLVLSMINLIDGRLVSGACDGKIKIWDVLSYKFNTLTSGSNAVRCMVELRDGSLASASNVVIQLWNTTTYQLIKTYQVRNIVFCFVQADNGDIVYGSDWGRLYLLSL